MNVSGIYEREGVRDKNETNTEEAMVDGDFGFQEKCKSKRPLLKTREDEHVGCLGNKTCKHCHQLPI